jgi:tetratricopeptide (TPR) repeat protein
VKHHQEALRYAIRSDSEPAQAIAISNIGLASVLKGDYTSARSCMERYLDLCQKARDMQGQARAFHNLGGIARQQGAARSAKNFYEQAIRAAGYIADGRLESQAKVALGIALGKLHLQAISEQKY